MSEKYVIKNGFIVDGSGDKGFFADIEISGDRINRISKTGLSSDNIIDVSGMVVAPGFIDIHSHSDYHILLNPYAESKIRQGVTTEVNGNCGYSIAPVDGIIKEEREHQYYDSYRLELNIKSLSDYISLVEKNGTSINIAMLVGHGTIRGSVMGRRANRATDEELNRMRKLVKESMEAGAFGMSTGLAYTPGAYADTQEIIELAKVVADYNGIYATHMRSEGRKLVEAVEEALEIGKYGGLPIEISHLKTMHPENWYKIDRVFELIESAQRNNIDVAADRYPYLSAYTGLASVMPDWVFADSTEAALKRLEDKNIRKKIEMELADQHKDLYGYLSRIVLSQCFTQEYKRFEGKNIVEIASELHIPPMEVIYNILIKEQLMTTAIYFVMNEDNLKRILLKPYVSIGSDAGLRANYGPLYEGKPHPRAYGTYPRVFTDFVNTGILSLEQAVHKMTLLPARRAGIKQRGMIREGWFADLVVFSKEQIKDMATYINPHVYPSGINTVIVNGKIVIRDGEHTKVLAGRMLKKNGVAGRDGARIE
ncbi:MAG: N-acyl-D-amino-acid deacylase family protein [bacterium]